MATAAEERLRGRRIIVVGASAGIGRAAALHASVLGAEVAVVGRRRPLLDALVEEMGRGLALDADLRDPRQCSSLVDRAVGRFGSVDALVFAASASTLALTRDANPETWRRVLETNVMAPALVTSALLPHLVSGAFLGYVSSEIVGQPYHGLVHYAASKAALEELVRGLRAEHPAFRFCCIRVGATDDTEFARDFSPDLTAELMGEWIARAKIPAKFTKSDAPGEAIARGVAIALTLPGVDLQDLTLRPPGGPLVEGAASLVEAVGEAVRQVGAGE